MAKQSSLSRKLVNYRQKSFITLAPAAQFHTMEEGFEGQTNKQTDRQSDRRAGRNAGRQEGRKAGRRGQADRRMSGQVGRCTDGQTERQSNI
jgi:hypothetical protein